MAKKQPATIGDNSSFGKDQLKSFVERLERLIEEKQSFVDDIKDVYAEARGQGFDVHALRTIIKMRKQDAAERAEQQLVLEIYMAALGMLATTPLGASAIERATTRTRQPTENNIGKILDAG